MLVIAIVCTGLLWLLVCGVTWRGCFGVLGAGAVGFDCVCCLLCLIVRVVSAPCLYCVCCDFFCCFGC